MDVDGELQKHLGQKFKQGGMGIQNNDVGGRIVVNIPGSERGADQCAQIRSGRECEAARDKRTRPTQSSKSGPRGEEKAELRQTEQK